MKGLIFLLCLLFSVINIVVSDINCVIGGIEADSCIDNKYIFNGAEYKISSEIDLPVGTSMEFKSTSTVYLTNTSSIHFHCKAISTFEYSIDCNQIEFGTLYSNAPNFKVDVDLSEFFNVNQDSPSSISLAYSEIMSSSNNDTLTEPLFYANITTSNNMSCSYRSLNNGNNITMLVNCEKDQILSRAIDISLKQSYCDSGYNGAEMLKAKLMDEFDIDPNYIYIKEYYTSPPPNFGTDPTLSGFYLRVYPLFGSNIDLDTLLPLISTKTYQNECGKLLKMTVTYEILTPYGVEPSENTSTSTSTTSTSKNDISVANNLQLPSILLILFISLMQYF